jgi:hypothetical protein
MCVCVRGVVAVEVEFERRGYSVEINGAQGGQITCW